MPDVKSAGKSITSGAGTSLGPTAASANSPTSDAVSKPNPNSTPTKYIFQAASTDARSRLQQPQRAKSPPVTSTRTCSPSSINSALWLWWCSRCSLFAARRHARNCGPTVARLNAPISVNVTDENTALTTAPVDATASTRDRMSEDPVATMPHSSTTIVEWPRLNQRPTKAAGFPE